MFNRTKSPAPQRSIKRVEEPIPPLPDLPSPTQSRRTASLATPDQPTPVAPSAVAPKSLSVLSSDLTFEGDISGSGDLQIDGSVKGDVRTGRLVIGETGAVEGSVSADYIEVRGRIVGGLNGKQVKLVGTAYVDGDITHDQLSIDVGAYFQGRCIQGGRAAPQQAPQAAAPAPVAAAVRAPEQPQTINMAQPQAQLA